MANDPKTPNDGEGLLSRWSRLKRGGEEPEASPAAPPVAADEADSVAADGAHVTDGANAAEAADGGENAADAGEEQAGSTRTFEDVDFDALDFNSDYTQFMGSDVPDDVRNRALAKLWESDPILANVDGLTDYSEDFTDAALAVPLGTLKTAYKVGQGFLNNEEVAEWDRLGRENDTDRSEPPATVATAPVSAAAVTEVTVAPESPAQDEIAVLFAASDAYSASLYPDESNHMVSDATLIGAGAVFLVARDTAAKAVGCGAIICDPSGTAEIKRMWVDPDTRRGGIGHKLLIGLLDAARVRQVSVVQLETGIHQPEAIALYRKHGFVERGPFGSYGDDPNSVFMERQLERPDEKADEGEDGDADLVAGE